MHWNIELKYGEKCNNKICATSSKPAYDTSGATIESKIEGNDNDDDDDQTIVLTCKKSSLITKQKRPVNNSVTTKHKQNTNKGFIRTLLY